MIDFSSIKFLCPKCKKPLNFENEIKSIVKCPKCSHFFLRILSKDNDLDMFITNDERQLFRLRNNVSPNYYDTIGLYVIVSHYYFDDRYLKIFKDKSKKTGNILERFLSKGKRNDLSIEEKRILYKLRNTPITKIQEKIYDKERDIQYLKAKSNCIKLLKVLYPKTRSYKE